MRHVARFLVVFPLAIAVYACGGGSGSNTTSVPPPPIVRTGIFVDGPIEGIAYATATQSGVTDSAGTFRYLDGEAITFSLGGTVIGEPVPANATMTPADLVPGLSVPTTSADAAAILRTPRAPESIAFARFLNILVFLQSLDQDANPDNGIRVPDELATLLDGIQIDFATDPTQFRSDSGVAPIMAHAADAGFLPSGVLRDRGRALDHFFTAQGIPMTVSRLSTRETDSDLDGIVDAVTVFGYDAAGNRVTEALDNGNDGIIDRLDTFAFDANGNELTWMHDRDGDGPELEITAQVLTYDSNGCVLSRTFDINLSGVLNRHRAYERTPDCTPLRLVADNDMNGIPETVVTFTYDDQGGWIESEDIGADGTIDQSAEISITVAPDGSWIQLENHDRDADGITDAINSYSYDLHGNLISRSYDLGGFQINSLWTFTYDDEGFLVKSTEDFDVSDGGTVDFSITYFYDADGMLITEEFDNLDNGVDSRTTLTYGSGNWYSFFKYTAM